MKTELSPLAVISGLLVLPPLVLRCCPAFVYVSPTGPLRRPTKSPSGRSWASTAATTDRLARGRTSRRCRSILISNDERQPANEKRLSRSSSGAAASGGRPSCRSSRLRLSARAKKAEASGEAKKKAKAAKTPTAANAAAAAVRDRKTRAAAAAAAATGGGASSPGIKALADAVNTGQFIDLSGGRNTCLKRVDKLGDESDGNPAKGSKVKVHYKMFLLGGEEIGSSGDERSKPFEFFLGRWPSEATHGWDKAVSTMHKGEVATLICGPQYAFGAAGAPPKIPQNATVETRLELVDWVDLAVTYNAVPGKVETDDELRARWKEELADGTSPMREEAGIDQRVQAEVERKEKTTPEDRDHRNKKVYDVNSDEARKIMAEQKVQGYTRDFGYIEKTNYLDLYIPVPKGTRAKDVTCEIHPDRMRVEVNGTGVVTEGRFQGKVGLDGSYWLMTDLSLDTPGSTAATKGDDVRQGPRNLGKTCVQVFLEKRKPYDTLWQDVFFPEEAEA